VSSFDEQVDTLTQINAREFLHDLGFGWVKWGRPFFEALCRPVGRQVSVDMARFDRLFATSDPRCAARAVLSELVGAVEVDGVHHLPARGPLLIASNHPGLCDVLTILATVERDDLIIVAADYPLLRALPGINHHFVFVPRRPDLRRSALTHIIGYLRNGGAVLMLPAGEIEPDPAVSQDAIVSLDRWSRSVGLIARHVPHLSIVPAVVSGVLLPRFQHHWLIWIRRNKSGRQELGTALQVLARASIAAKVRLVYGQPIESRDFAERDLSAAAITSVVIERVRELMVNHCPPPHGPPARRWPGVRRTCEDTLGVELVLACAFELTLLAQTPPWIA
jgi:1-acyl-sn-glycerol-3-phosphate acyltransferase